MKPNIWHYFSVEKTLRLLKTSAQGLTSKEVLSRREQYGLNKISQQKRLSSLEILFYQFKNPLIYILLLACLITLFLGHIIDFFVILFVILINTIISFIQDYKADKSLQKLQSNLKYYAKVLRNNVKKRITLENIVLGDIVFLEAGDKVPADCRIIDSKNLQCEEALLTGESMPSEKSNISLEKDTSLADRENMVYFGTTVSRGKATVVVTAIGANTEIGKIAQTLKATKEQPTPLQEQISFLSRKLGIIILCLAVFIFVLGILRGHDIYTMLLSSLALAVAAIPEGLPAAVTITLALGVQKIYLNKGLVRRISSAESLGSASVICADKTGTLTLGKLKADQVIVFDKNVLPQILKLNNGKEKSKDNSIYSNQIEVLKTGLLAGSASIENPKEKIEKWKILGDLLDRAIVIASGRLSIFKEKLEKQFVFLDEIPFNENIRYSASLNNFDEENNIFNCKGAPEKIISFCSYIKLGESRENLDLANLTKIKETYEKISSKGYKVIGLAIKKVKKTDKKFRNKPLSDYAKDMTFLGFIVFKDILRKEARLSLKVAMKAGIKPVILTGDHKLTAIAIAKELGMKTEEKNILTGRELAKLSDENFKKIIKDISVFARVEPSQKIRIVKTFQGLGEIVAMTGDGVNDALAVKAADIGIALAEGSDVTKETADLVLLDNNFATINYAIEKGRIIFENIRKSVLFLLKDCFSQILLFFGSLILGLPMPLIALQILWLNLAENGLPSIALAFEQGEKEVMNEKPKRKNKKILNYQVKTMIFYIGIIGDLITLAIYYFFYKQGIHQLSYLQTLIFFIVGLDSMFYLFSIRSFRYTLLQKNPFANKILTLSAIFGIFLLLFAVYNPFMQNILQTKPLIFMDLVLVFLLTLIKLGGLELIKYFFIIKRNNANIKAKTI